MSKESVNVLNGAVMCDIIDVEKNFNVARTTFQTLCGSLLITYYRNPFNARAEVVFKGASLSDMSQWRNKQHGAKKKVRLKRSCTCNI